MGVIHLVLPYPVSANRYWRNRVMNGVVINYVSAEAKAYKQEVDRLARAAGVRAPIEGKMRLDCKLYPKRPQDWATRARKDPERWEESVGSIDLDNASKVTLDALKGIAFNDDKWVWSTHWERAIPDERGARVEITISRFERPTVTMALPLEIEA